MSARPLAPAIHTCPVRTALTVLALLSLTLTGCSDQSIDPDRGYTAQLGLAASAPEEAAAQLALVDAWRVQILRPGEGVLAQETGTIGPEQISISVQLSITLQSPCESLTVLIELSGEGEIWFRSQDTREICVGSGNSVPVQELEWLGPTVELQPTQLSFTADQATNPTAQTFTVRNGGGGVLAWSATTDDSWLQVSPASGALTAGGSRTVSLAVTSEDLAPGQFQGSVVVTGLIAADSPATLPVSLTVIEVANSVLRGTVSADETGLEGLTVSISGKESGNTLTDASGDFEFAGLTAGSYVVSVTNPPVGVSFPFTSQNVSLGVNDTQAVDFGGTYIRTSNVQGVITADGVGVSGVEVTLSGTESGTATTDESGNYSFTELRTGAYTVSLSEPPVGVLFPSTSQNLTLGVGESLTVDFPGSYIRTSVIVGSVTLEGSALPGVTVTLGGTESGSTTTDSSGGYSFSGLRAGSYTVTVSGYPADVVFSTTTQNVSLGVGETEVVDFQGSYVRTSEIRGRVSADDTRLSGVRVTFSGPDSGTTFTNSNGDYSFPQIRAGTYTITISNLPDGTVFEVTSKMATVADEESIRIDFAGILLQLPNDELSYIEACPAVIPPPGEITLRTTVTAAVLDQFGDPIPGASVFLSLVPGDDYSFFDSQSLTTNSSGLASTRFYSEFTGSKTFAAEMTANNSTIVVQESGDLYVDIDRWSYLVGANQGQEQTIVAGESGSFSVKVLDQLEQPASNVPVGWEIEGGNCLYSFTNAQGIAGISLSVPSSTAPGLYRVIANIAKVDWDADPWDVVKVEFVYQVLAALNAAPSADGSGVASRIEGRPIQAGGR